jgi:hypothetical protein
VDKTRNEREGGKGGREGGKSEGKFYLLEGGGRVTFVLTGLLEGP